MKRDPNSDAPNFFSFAREYLHTYLPTVRGLSPRTIEAYRISLECYVGYLADHENVPPERVSFDHFDRGHLKDWLAWMKEDRHYAPATIALRLSAVRAFLTYSSHEDITLVALSQAAKALRSPASPRKPIEYFAEPETRAILAAFTGRTAKSRRNRMMLILLYDSAARVGEITGLNLGNLSLDEPGRVILTGKGRKTRVVPLSDKTVEHLRVYLDEFHPNAARQPTTRPLFYSLRHGQPSELSTDTLSAVLKQAADIERSNCPTIPEKVHCHILRRTKAMDLYQQGIPLPIIMRLLGHENMSTTAAFYAFATMDMMRQAINAATPAIDTSASPDFNESRLQALYSLR
ncbi:MAG: tyrosine-type recombinase/integrase [Acidimicrobiales bacterium]